MPWLSLPDYARRTGTPESTVRAAIRKGTLEGHQEQRAPGDPRVVWKVWVDDPQEQPQEAAEPSADQIEPDPPSTSETAITGIPEIVRAAVEPWERRLEIADALIRANGETLERQAEQIAELREQRGRLEARLTAAETELARARRPWWRQWFS
jgi:hypothetical protein